MISVSESTSLPPPHTFKRPQEVYHSMMPRFAMHLPKVLSHHMDCFREDLNALSFSDPLFSNAYPVKCSDSQEKMFVIMMARSLAKEIGVDSSFPRLNHLRDIGDLPTLWKEGLNFSISPCILFLQYNHLHISKMIFDLVLACSSHWDLSGELKHSYGFHPLFIHSPLAGQVNPMDFDRLGQLAYFILETDRSFYHAKRNQTDPDRVILDNLDLSKSGAFLEKLMNIAVIE